MKKKLLSALLCAVLTVALLPVISLASGNDFGYWDVRSYDELEAALADPNADTIIIWAEWPINDLTGEMGYFSWPTDERTLILDPASNTVDIYVNNELTIPENITVHAYEQLTLSGDYPLTVNGDWYIKNQLGVIGGITTSGGVRQGSAVFNGDLYVQNNYSGLWYVGKTVINGTMYIEGSASVAHLELGDGALVSGGQLSIYDTLSCPTGSATVDSRMTVNNGSSSGISNADYVTLSGNLELSNLVLSRTDVLIPSGSKITVADASDNYSNAITVNGELDLASPEYTNYFGLGNTQITVGSGGKLILRPGSQLGTDSGSGSISGDGQLRLYAQVPETEDGWYDRHPQLYSVQTYKAISEKVTIANIWKNWEDAADCAHNWEALKSTPANCAEYARITYICANDDCGATKIVEDVDGGKTDDHQWNWYTSGSVIGHNCSRCHSYGNVTLSAKNGLYTGEPVTDVASATYSEKWIGGEVTFSYSNNIEPGEKTAIAYMHCNGKTVSTKFSIFEGDCAHNGGKAYCYAQAVCENCGESYGSKPNHDFYVYDKSMYTYDSDQHTVTCQTEGCTETKSSAHSFYATEYDEMLNQELGTENFNSHRCLRCGYGSFSDVISVADGAASVEVTHAAQGDTVVAAIYDENGKFLGCGLKTVETAGSVTLDFSYQGNADTLRVFSFDKFWCANRPASTEVPLSGK